MTGGVDDATRYSNDVYDQMLKAGIDPKQAEAQRQVQLARHKAPEMSKQALQDRKMQMEILKSQYEKNSDLNKAMGKSSESSGGYITGYDSDNNPIYGVKPSGRNSGSTKYNKNGAGQDFKSFFSDKGQFSGGKDFLSTGDDPEVAQNRMTTILTELRNDPKYSRMSEKDLTNAATQFISGSRDKLSSLDPSIEGSDQQLMNEAKKLYDARGGYSGSGSSSTGSNKGGFTQGSFTGWTDEAKAKAAKSQALLDSNYKKDMQNIMNSGNKPGKKAVLDSIFNYHTEPVKKKAVADVKKNTNKKNNKILKDAKAKVEKGDFNGLSAKETILLDKDIRNNDTVISPEGTIEDAKYKPFDASNPDVVNPQYDGSDDVWNNYINNVVPQDDADKKFKQILGLNKEEFGTDGFNPTGNQVLADNNEAAVRKARRYDRYSQKAGEMFGDIAQEDLVPGSKYNNFDTSNPNTADTVNPRPGGPVLTDLDVQNDGKILNDMILSYRPENEIVAQIQKMFPHLDEAAARKLIQRRQEQLPN